MNNTTNDNSKENKDVQPQPANEQSSNPQVNGNVRSMSTEPGEDNANAGDTNNPNSTEQKTPEQEQKEKSDSQLGGNSKNSQDN